jgi:hypothetical protein
MTDRKPSAYGKFADGVVKFRDYALVNVSSLLANSVRTSPPARRHAEKIIERALRLGVGRDGRRFQELADSARAIGKPDLGRIVEVQARQGGRFFRNCGAEGSIAKGRYHTL